MVLPRSSRHRPPPSPAARWWPWSGHGGSSGDRGWPGALRWCPWVHGTPLVCLFGPPGPWGAYFVICGHANEILTRYAGRLGEMGHLRRLGGRWSALGGARRPRPAPAAAHRPCRSPGPHPAHSGPRTTAQAATRGQIRPPWAQIGWLQRACHGHVSVVCGQSTCPRGPGAVLRVPWGHARWCGVLGRPWGGSRPVVGSVSVHTSFLSQPRSFLCSLVTQGASN